MTKFGYFLKNRGVLFHALSVVSKIEPTPGLLILSL